MNDGIISLCMKYTKHETHTDFFLLDEMDNFEYHFIMENNGNFLVIPDMENEFYVTISDIATRMMRKISVDERGNAMFEIRIKTGNAAFHDEDPELDDVATRMEIIRILNEVKQKLGNGDSIGGILDINGNRCGEWHM